MAAVGPPEGNAKDIDALMATFVIPKIKYGKPDVHAMSLTHEFRIAKARPMRENSENVRPSSFG